MKKTIKVRQIAVSNICPSRLSIKVPMDAPVGRLKAAFLLGECFGGPF